MRHTIFFDSYIDLRAGGPCGYLANLRFGLDRLDDHLRDPLVWIERVRRGPQHEPQVPTEEDLNKLIRWYSQSDQLQLTDEQYERIMVGGTRSIHAHTSTDACTIIQTLDHKSRTDIPVLLTSHCPESLGNEMRDLWHERGFNPDKAAELGFASRAVEEIAFRRSNVWIFPSKEAMEPYEATIPEFRHWARAKDIRYVPTGACAVSTSLTKQQAKERFSVSGKKVIAYLGRHNSIKGYDILSDVGMRILNERDDVAVLIAGKPEPIAPPNHERWVEVGWYPNPADILMAADVFVLPNRQTYFDLVLLEVMSIGVPIVASATGGNKSVHGITSEAIVLYDGGVDAFKAAVERVLDNERGVADQLREKSRTAYETYFTPVQFAKNYVNVIKEIYHDYQLL